MQKNIPAISIIIPMYNVEKYIGECLDSILAQTFTDYEVIVVDDCSTDKSCDVVESFMPKFGEKLQLIRSKVNSGGCPGIPRNTGIKIARGEYVLFIDSDDAITKTALEELFNAAKNFQADLIHCGAFRRAKGEVSLADYENFDTVIGSKNISLVEEPVIFSNKLSERVKAFGTGKFNTTTWNYLYRREFLLQNQITFPNLMRGEDEVFDFMAICLAKKFVLIPNVFYVYRMRGDSLNRSKLTLNKHVHNWFGSTIRAIEIYENFMEKFPQFEENPNLKYIVFEFFASHNVSNQIMPVYTNFTAPSLDALIRKELADIKDKTTLAAFLFNRMNIFQVRLNLLQQKFSQLEKQLEELQKLPTD